MKIGDSKPIIETNDQELQKLMNIEKELDNFNFDVNPLITKLADLSVKKDNLLKEIEKLNKGREQYFSYIHMINLASPIETDEQEKLIINKNNDNGINDSINDGINDNNDGINDSINDGINDDSRNLRISEEESIVKLQNLEKLRNIEIIPLKTTNSLNSSDFTNSSNALDSLDIKYHKLINSYNQSLKKLDEQIENIETKVHYILKIFNRGTIKNNSVICSICLEKNADTALQCGHIMCSSCIGSSTKCHMCRAQIINKFRLYI
jgi:hypothetical protein